MFSPFDVGRPVADRAETRSAKIMLTEAARRSGVGSRGRGSREHAIERHLESPQIVGFEICQEGADGGDAFALKPDHFGAAGSRQTQGGEAPRLRSALDEAASLQSVEQALSI